MPRPACHLGQLERGQLCLHFQPKVDCRQGRVVGVEALIRWNHPVLGVLGPAEFIPLIDHDDLIIQIGEWVIGEAMRHLQQLHAAGHRIVVSINIAAYQFLHTQFSKRLEMYFSSQHSLVSDRVDGGLNYPVCIGIAEQRCLLP